MKTARPDRPGLDREMPNMLTRLAAIVLALAIGLAGLMNLSGCVNINVKEKPKDQNSKSSD